MADLVAPFRGERYAAVDRLSSLIAPPYDVIDPAERARYAALDRDNIVHIMLPEAPPGAADDARYRVAGEQLAAWRRAAVLRRDPEPALYVLAQDFTLPTGDRLRAGETRRRPRARADRISAGSGARGSAHAPRDLRARPRVGALVAALERMVRCSGDHRRPGPVDDARLRGARPHRLSRR